jgi:hypothetical protein
MIINNDLTNTFGFYGQGGIGPGQHTLDEFVSSIDFGNIANIFNKLSWITAYSEESTERHISVFYGSILFRDIDTTMSALLDQTFANYGITLGYDNQDATTSNDIFNVSTNTFNILLQYDLIIGSIPPYFRVEALYNSATLDKYRASVVDYSFPYISVALFDCESGSQFTSTEYAALSDYDLKLYLFGYRPVNVAVI